MRLPIPLLLLPLILTTACADLDEAGGKSYASNSEVAGSDAAKSVAAKQAAARLSIANIGELGDEDELTREVKCAAALGATDSLIGESALRTQEQMAAIRQAGNFFEARARTAAVTAGIAASEASEMIEQRQEAFMLDRGDLGSTALACLRAGMASDAAANAH